MVMACAAGMGDAALRERLPALWRRIEHAHYSYLEVDDSPEKLQLKKKLEDYIIEYLSLVPHECKFGLAETGKVFQRTIDELPDFSAYRAGLGWAALARYAANLLAQPWRKEYRVIRLYCGYFKHEVEANLVDAETLLLAMGYRAAGAGRLALLEPVCPDMVAAVSRDALIAQCECQIMCQIWEAVWSGGSRTSWRGVARARAARQDHTGTTHLYNDVPGSEIYSNVPATFPTEPYRHSIDPQYNGGAAHCMHARPDDAHPPALLPPYAVPPLLYPPYAALPYYYPVHPPYMLPAPVYAPVRHAATLSVNGCPPAHYACPAVPTARLIELDAPSVYENGNFERYRDDDRHGRTGRERRDASRRNSTSKSGFSDVTLPSLPRSDTQPALSKAREDGMGTYESWDYVFRNLSSKDRDDRSRISPSLDRDSRTLDRLDRDERRTKYQPTTLDLEDGLQALHLDRTYDEEVYRTAKVNENLMRLKQEQEVKRARHLARKQAEEKKVKRLPEPVGNPKADALIAQKVAPDKVKLLTKKDVKDRKDVIKQQSSMNGSVSNAAEVKKVKKPAKLVAVEVEKPKNKVVENGVLSTAHSSKSNPATIAHHQNDTRSTKLDLKAQLVVSLDEADYARRSPPKQPQHNGERPPSRASSQHASERERPDVNSDRWECGTCTYLNKGSVSACEMCGKSKRGPEIQPLTSGGRECPACTLVNQRNAKVCDACATSLDHCPTYI